MEEFVNGMCEKVGIDRETANKVVDYIKDNADKLPQLLGQIPGASGIMDKVGGMFGGNDN